MQQLAIDNPFKAPVYHEQTVGSTMEVSRTLARHGEAHGTVIVADYQETGRGRIHQRPWDMERETGLPFTILLRYPCIEAIPQALTLRAGLAVSLAIEEFAPTLAGRVMIKWPNDIMVSGAPAKKITGILAEADGGNVHIGIGVNVAQQNFPAHLQDKASSIYLAANTEANRNMAGDERFVLLAKILTHLYNELTPAHNINTGTDWKNRIEARLYKKGEEVNFAESAADSGKIVTGVIAGIGNNGELLIVPAHRRAGEDSVRSFITGELLFADYTRDG